MSNKVQDSTIGKAFNIMEFIIDHHIRYGISPTIREIQKELSISSTSVVNHYLVLLEDAGYIWRVKGQGRGIRMNMKCEYAGPPLYTAALRERLA